MVYLWASIETMTYWKYKLHYFVDTDLNELLLPENMMHLTVQLRPRYTRYTLSWAFLLFFFLRYINLALGHVCTIEFYLTGQFSWYDLLWPVYTILISSCLNEPQQIGWAISWLLTHTVTTTSIKVIDCF